MPNNIEPPDDLSSDQSQQNNDIHDRFNSSLNTILAEDEKLYIEQKVMRITLFGIMILFGSAFLTMGGYYTHKAVDSIITLQKLSVESKFGLIDTNTKENKYIIADTARYLNTNNINQGVNEEQNNYIMTGSLIALVAFLLAVGLTLLLTLMRNAFSNKNSTSDNNIKLATPLSGLIEDFIEYLRKIKIRKCK